MGRRSFASLARSAPLVVSSYVELRRACVGVGALGRGEEAAARAFVECLRAFCE